MAYWNRTAELSGFIQAPKGNNISAAAREKEAALRLFSYSQKTVVLER